MVSICRQIKICKKGNKILINFTKLGIYKLSVLYQEVYRGKQLWTQSPNWPWLMTLRGAREASRGSGKRRITEKSCWKSGYMSDKIVFLWGLNYISPDGKALKVFVFPEEEVSGKLSQLFL